MLSSRTRVWVCLLLAGAMPACTGGPISDLPRDNSADPDQSGQADAGMTPGEGSDGTGTDGLPPDGTDGSDGNGGDGSPGDDGTNADAGGVPSDGLDGGTGSDAGVELPDGGGMVPDAGSMCTSASDGRPEACYGVYCATTLEQLTNESTTGACTDTAELALVCDGAITRSVAQCAQDHALSPTFTADVTQCARADSALSAGSDDCLDCYVAEISCVLQNCLALCVGGFAEDCEMCRQQNCADAFQACAGLPPPH